MKVVVKKKTSLASLAFHSFSTPTRLINSINHEHSCKILYVKVTGSLVYNFNFARSPSITSQVLNDYSLGITANSDC